MTVSFFSAKVHTTPLLDSHPQSYCNLTLLGDFSFAASLVTHHACTSLTATTFETSSMLLSKHPQAAMHISTLLSSSQKVLYSIDATKLGLPLPGGGGPAIRKVDWDRIIFNFPHVGGLTKDVNRQVRANQEMLVAFLERSKALLGKGGTVVVTVFEGEPYELWNIRNLARHVGLRVVRSFRFEAGVYPGYKHARTLGNVKGGGGWKGEERAARTYVFGVQGEENELDVERKRKRADEDDGDDGDEIEGSPDGD